MHRFLTAFVCLSTLAMTQNVVAGTASPFQADALPVRVVEGAAPAVSASVDPALSRASVGGEVPSPGTMLLLVTGLAGLSAVGERGRARRTALASAATSGS